VPLFSCQTSGSPDRGDFREGGFQLNFFAHAEAWKVARCPVDRANIGSGCDRLKIETKPTELTEYQLNCRPQFVALQCGGEACGALRFRCGFQIVSLFAALND
jgi:hypothetical protein